MTRMNVCSKNLTARVLLTAATVIAGTRIVAAQPEEPPPPNTKETKRDVELPAAADREDSAEETERPTCQISDKEVDATQETATSAEPIVDPTGEAANPKPEDQTPAAEAAWGEAVDGVQVWLRAEKAAWKASDIVALTVEVRNGAKRTLFDTPGRSDIFNLEFDGQWYADLGKAEKRQVEILAGRERDGFRVALFALRGMCIR